MNHAWTWTAANERKAMRRLGVTAYRPGQRQLIQAVLSGRHAVGILPTGGGKSLCFQLPSLFLPHAVLVVSPLISLMQDQEQKLRARRIASATLNSAVSNSDEQRTIQDIRDRTLEMIYVTPERLEDPDYLDMLKQTGVSLVVVDEAHCVSQWGHDFRPSYLAIRDAVRKLGRPPVLALTATATPEVVDDIITQLDIGGAVVVNHGVNRPNLIFEVFRTVNEEEKLERLMSLIGPPAEGPGIVYVATVRQAEEVHAAITRAGIPAGCYHGRRPSGERRRTQQAFMNDEFRAVVATKAFGLGIDKPDLRFVIHYAFPDSLESYVQEAGRAGRDGKPAHAVLLYRLEDRRVQAYFLGGKYPRREECLQVYRAVTTLQSGGGASAEWLAERVGLPLKRLKVIAARLEKAGVLNRTRGGFRVERDFRTDEDFAAYLDDYDGRQRQDEDRLATMMKYGQTTECRVRFLTRYFSKEIH
ncbi:MAG TPA: RecQ family ATP-dependent DNA helicase, partial [Nitrospiraceae bacterium]|nr:RecQ family ATP-dependent DNA helicase [Nitrospiraceae bacterium]